MKAIVQNGYGSRDVLSLKEIEKPTIKDDEVLVRVLATSLNAGDYFSMVGRPLLVRFVVGFPRPKDYVPGWDLAGRIEAVGSAVSSFQPGDAVYGAVSHAFAEYVSAAAVKFAMKPSSPSSRPRPCPRRRLLRSRACAMRGRCSQGSGC
jgi:NADPH:quinone reductase-like Zn-dependent oxidoreductase